MTGQPHRTGWAARRRRTRVSVALAAAVFAGVTASVPAGAAPVATAYGPVAQNDSSGAVPEAVVAPGAGTAPPGMAAARVPAADGDRPAPYPELLPRATGEAPLAMTVTQVRPAVAVPGTDVTIDVAITNQGLVDGSATVQPRIGAPVQSRSELDAPVDLQRATAVGEPATVTNLAPGATGTTQLTLPADRLTQTAPYGVLPLLLTATTTGGSNGQSATLRTYLPFENRKEYEPLQLGIAVPLTSDADPALTDPDPATSEAAWARQTAPGSRLDRILRGTSATTVTYAVDPGLVGPAATTPAPPPTQGPGPASPGASGTPSTTGGSTSGTGTSTPWPAPSPTPTSAAPPTGTQASSPARAAFATRLAQSAASRPFWALPATDPDLSQLVRTDAGPSTLARLAAPDGRLAGDVAPKSLTRVAWPEGALRPDEVRRVEQAYGADWSGPFVLPLGDSQPAGWTGDAARQFAEGPSVLAYDETLSRILADTTAAATPARPGLTQRFLAETMTILQEFPGRQRHVLAVAPRDFDPDPTTLAALLRTADSTPWLRTVSTDVLTGAAAERDAAAATAPDDAATRPAPFPTGGSPLDAGRVDVIETDLRRVGSLAAALPAGSPTLAAVREDLQSLLSLRWRGEGVSWERSRAATQDRADALLRGVSVVDSQINFFAESGTLQVTVVNTLDVDVHDVQLHLNPQGRQVRLRLPSTPYVLSIAAHSRATVKVPVEALAAGPTVVSAQVTTADGTRLGAQDATLTVQVQPSTGWLVGGIGGAAAVVFLVGLFRTIRRNRPRVSAQDLEEIDLE